MIFKSSNYAETTEQKPETGMYILPTNFFNKIWIIVTHATRRNAGPSMRRDGVQGNASAPPLCVFWKIYPLFQVNFQTTFSYNFCRIVFIKINANTVTPTLR